MNANAVRMMTSAGCGLVAVYLLDLGVAGFFAAVAAGFCVYAALLVRAVFGVRATRRRICDEFLTGHVDSMTHAAARRSPRDLGCGCWIPWHFGQLQMFRALARR